jgi:hypothetical protein
MKKLLAIVLVLGMASIASAAQTALSLDGTSDAPSAFAVNPGDVITITTLGDSVAGLSYLDMAKNSAASMAAPVALAAAGNIASVADYSTGSLFDYELSSADSAGAIAAGAQFTALVTVTGVDGDSFVVELLNGVNYGVEDSIAFTVVPEPLTMSLLGLGGLAMIRRRRA